MFATSSTSCSLKGISTHFLTFTLTDAGGEVVEGLIVVEQDGAPVDAKALERDISMSRVRAAENSVRNKCEHSLRSRSCACVFPKC